MSYCFSDNTSCMLRELYAAAFGLMTDSLFATTKPIVLFVGGEFFRFTFWDDVIY